jgi:hypothetical protein
MDHLIAEGSPGLFSVARPRSDQEWTAALEAALVNPTYQNFGRFCIVTA